MERIYRARKATRTVGTRGKAKKWMSRKGKTTETSTSAPATIDPAGGSSGREEGARYPERK
jgi:hypothetical protein